jgi:aspartate aminotransferase/aminotransferase
MADRARALRENGVRDWFDVARRTPGCVDLTLGQPCAGIARGIREEAAAALDQDDGAYGPTEGVPEFLESLAEHLERRYGARGPAILATAGITGGLHLACQTLFEPGDDVLVPDPGFIAHGALVELAGARAVPYSTWPDFRLRRASLESALTPSTRGVVVCNPGNPGGAVATEDEVGAAAAFARDHGLWLLADEAYAGLAYDAPHVSVKRFAPDAILFGGFSKSHSIAGWRLGFVHGPPEVVERMRALQQYVVTCAPTFAQRAMVRALSGDDPSIRDSLQKRRDLAVEILGELIETPPQGGLFVFFPAPWGTATAFACRCLARGVAIVPGIHVSSRDTHCRATFSAGFEALHRGFTRIRDVAREGA